MARGCGGRTTETTAGLGRRGHGTLRRGARGLRELLGGGGDRGQHQGRRGCSSSPEPRRNRGGRGEQRRTPARCRCSGGLGGTRRGLGAAGESRGPYIGRGEASGAHGRAPDQALMEGRGWAWHGHGVCDTFMAKHDEAATQGHVEAHGAATRHVGGRDEEGGDENSGKNQPEHEMSVTPS